MADDSLNYFSDNEKFIIITLIILSMLSLIGSVFIILTYICFKKIRNYAYKLVVYLSFADIILNIGNLLSIGTMQDQNQDSRCIAQAFMINYGGLASILWTSVIAWSIYSATVLSSKNLRAKNCRYLLFGFGVSLILSVIPFMTKQYGRAGLYCWIKNDDLVKDTVMRFVQFYIPLWIAILFNVYAYVKVISFIKKYISTNLEVRFIHRLKYYPMILLFCWFFATVNRIYNIFGKENEILTFLHVFFGGLQGILNALVYGTNDQVKQVWKETFCCCFVKPTSYARYDGTDSSLKKNEEMQQRQENEEHHEENHNPQIGDQQNVSVELVQTREVSERSKKNNKKANKLIVKV